MKDVVTLMMRLNDLCPRLEKAQDVLHEQMHTFLDVSHKIVDNHERYNPSLLEEVVNILEDIVNTFECANDEMDNIINDLRGNSK